MRLSVVIPLFVVSVAAGQMLPATRPAAGTRPATASGPGTASTRASSKPKNLERVLDDLVTIDAEAQGLEKFTDYVRDLTQTNLVVNWNALAEAGITRDTPVTLHLKDLAYEQVIRTLIEVLPTKGTKGNYSVGENALEITTNREIGTENSSHLYDLARSISYSFNTPVTRAEQERNIGGVAAVLKAELERAGEPLDAKGHDLSVKDGILLATCSERGQGVISRMVNMFNQPIKVGQLAGGTQLTATSKKARDAWLAFQGKADAPTVEAVAREPRKYGQFNVALLPGTREELAKEKPALRYAISDGGVVLLGPEEAIRARTLLAIYDLREVMKKVAAKSKITPPPLPGDVQKAIVQVVQTTVKPEGEEWGGDGDLGKKPAVMIPYSGLLIVFGTAETQRMVAGAVQDMNK